MSQLVRESVDEFVQEDFELNEEELNEAKKKKKKWIQGMFKSAKKKGTEGDCSGEKFGSSSCPAGSKKYNAAKNLRAIAKKK